MLVTLKHYTPNIGDDIQKLGLATILPEDTVYINRQNRDRLLALPHTAKLIVNGWFNRNIHDWYSNLQCQTLYIGFYINKAINLNGSIGCRDTHTLGLYGNGWLSYCTSLLLGGQNRTRKRNGVVICDVAPHHLVQIRDEIVLNATIVNHEQDWSGMDRDAEANRLLDIYANAELVITSRLHALLPCLAFGTPVVFTNRDFEPQRANGYEGLYWTLDDVPWSISAPDKHNPWIHIPPKVSPEFIRGMTQPMKHTIQKFIHS